MKMMKKEQKKSKSTTAAAAEVIMTATMEGLVEEKDEKAASLCDAGREGAAATRSNHNKRKRLDAPLCWSSSSSSSSSSSLSLLPDSVPGKRTRRTRRRNPFLPPLPFRPRDAAPGAASLGAEAERGATAAAAKTAAAEGLAVLVGGEKGEERSGIGSGSGRSKSLEEHLLTFLSRSSHSSHSSHRRQQRRRPPLRDGIVAELLSGMTLPSTTMTTAVALDAGESEHDDDNDDSGQESDDGSFDESVRALTSCIRGAVGPTGATLATMTTTATTTATRSDVAGLLLPWAVREIVLLSPPSPSPHLDSSLAQRETLVTAATATATAAAASATAASTTQTLPTKTWADAATMTAPTAWNALRACLELASALPSPSTAHRKRVHRLRLDTSRGDKLREPSFSPLPLSPLSSSFLLLDSPFHIGSILTAGAANKLARAAAVFALGPMPMLGDGGRCGDVAECENGQGDEYIYHHRYKIHHHHQSAVSDSTAAKTTTAAAAAMVAAECYARLLDSGACHPIPPLFDGASCLSSLSSSFSFVHSRGLSLVTIDNLVQSYRIHVGGRRRGGRGGNGGARCEHCFRAGGRGRGCSCSCSCSCGFRAQSSVVVDNDDNDVIMRLIVDSTLRSVRLYVGGCTNAGGGSNGSKGEINCASVASGGGGASASAPSANPKKVFVALSDKRALVALSRLGGFGCDDDDDDDGDERRRDDGGGGGDGGNFAIKGQNKPSSVIALDVLRAGLFHQSHHMDGFRSLELEPPAPIVLHVGGSGRDGGGDGRDNRKDKDDNNDSDEERQTLLNDKEKDKNKKKKKKKKGKVELEGVQHETTPASTMSTTKTDDKSDNDDDDDVKDDAGGGSSGKKEIRKKRRSGKYQWNLLDSMDGLLSLYFSCHTSNSDTRGYAAKAGRDDLIAAARLLPSLLDAFFSQSRLREEDEETARQEDDGCNLGGSFSSSSSDRRQRQQQKQQRPRLWHQGEVMRGRGGGGGGGGGSQTPQWGESNNSGAAWAEVRFRLWCRWTGPLVRTVAHVPFVEDGGGDHVEGTDAKNTTTTNTAAAAAAMSVDVDVYNDNVDLDVVVLVSLRECLSLLIRWDLYRPSFSDPHLRNFNYLSSITEAVLRRIEVRRRWRRNGDDTAAMTKEDDDDGEGDGDDRNNEADADDAETRVDEEVLRILLLLLDINHLLVHGRLSRVLRFASSCLGRTFESVASVAAANDDVDDDGGGRGCACPREGCADRILVAISDTYSKLRQLGHLFRSYLLALPPPSPRAAAAGGERASSLSSASDLRLAMRVGSPAAAALASVVRLCPRGQVPELWHALDGWIRSTMTRTPTRGDRPKGPKEEGGGVPHDDDDYNDDNESLPFVVDLFVLLVRALTVDGSSAGPTRELCLGTSSTTVPLLVRREPTLACGLRLFGWLVDLDTRCRFWMDVAPEDDERGDGLRGEGGVAAAAALSGLGGGLGDGAGGFDALSYLLESARAVLGRGGGEGEGRLEGPATGITAMGALQRLACHRLEQLHFLIHRQRLIEDIEACRKGTAIDGAGDDGCGDDDGDDIMDADIASDAEARDTDDARGRRSGDDPSPRGVTTVKTTVATMKRNSAKMTDEARLLAKFCVRVAEERGSSLYASSSSSSSAASSAADAAAEWILLARTLAVWAPYSDPGSARSFLRWMFGALAVRDDELGIIRPSVVGGKGGDDIADKDSLPFPSSSSSSSATVLLLPSGDRISSRLAEEERATAVALLKDASFYEVQEVGGIAFGVGIECVVDLLASADDAVSVVGGGRQSTLIPRMMMRALRLMAFLNGVSADCFFAPMTESALRLAEFADALIRLCESMKAREETSGDATVKDTAVILQCAFYTGLGRVMAASMALEKQGNHTTSFLTGGKEVSSLLRAIFRFCEGYLSEDEDRNVKLLSSSGDVVSELLSRCVRLFTHDSVPLEMMCSIMTKFISDRSQSSVGLRAKFSLVRSAVHRMVRLNFVPNSSGQTHLGLKSTSGIRARDVCFDAATQILRELRDTVRSCRTLRCSLFSKYDGSYPELLVLIGDTLMFWCECESTKTSIDYAAIVEHVLDDVLAPAMKDISFEQPKNHSPLTSKAMLASEYVVACVSTLPGLYVEGMSMNLSREILIATRKIFVAYNANTNPLLDAALHKLVQQADAKKIKMLIDSLHDGIGGKSNSQSSMVAASSVHVFRLLFGAVRGQEQRKVVSAHTRTYVSLALSLLYPFPWHGDSPGQEKYWQTQVLLAADFINSVIEKSDLFHLTGCDIPMILGRMVALLPALPRAVQGERRTVCYQIYSSVCRIVASLLKSYYRRLYGCAPSLVSVYHSLLSHAIESEYGCYNDTKRAGHAKAKEFVKLCEMLSAHKDVFKKHAVGLILDYVDFMEYSLPKRDLTPALYALLDMCSAYETQQLNIMMSVNGKALFRTVYKNYKKVHQYKGQ